MPDEPRVSVLMGVYNEADYLGDAIDSILAQTFKDFEFLIVDDASTDGSRDIVASYDDPRIQLIKNEANCGLTYSLNRGLEVATGEYVARQDADDVSESTRIERQVAFLETNDSVSLVGSGALLVDDEGSTIERRTGYCNPSYDDFLKKNRLVHGSILARRDALEAVDGYDEFFRYAQDYDLWLRLLENHRMANITEPLYRLRVHDDSVYFAEKDKSILYSTFARHLSTGEAESEVKAELRDEGILVYWKHLDNAQRAAVHRELAIRYLRYGHRQPAIEECRRARYADGLDLTTLLLFGLANSTRRTVKVSKWLMRRYLNARTRVHNWFSCPYHYPAAYNR